MNAYHPACCSPLDDHDPLPRPLAGTQLISTRFDPALPSLEVDPDQVKEALVNLLINAREAMQPGGRLALTTRSGENARNTSSPIVRPLSSSWGCSNSRVVPG